MWPTFFIPGLARYIELIFGEVDHICGKGTYSSASPLIVSNPPSLASGDTQLVFVTYTTNTSEVWPDDTDGWYQVFGSSIVQGSGAWPGNQKAYCRKWNGTDGPFTVTMPSGAVSAAWISVSLGRGNANDPLFTGYLMLPEANVSLASTLEGPAQYLQAANIGDVLFQFSGSDPDWLSTDEPSGDDVEFACTHVGTLYGHTVSGMYARNRANNLLPYSKVQPAGWTLNALTRDTVSAFSTKCKPALRLYSSGGTTKHYAETEVALEAGKTYAFVMSYLAKNDPSTRYYMTYKKPDTSEHGAGWNAAFDTVYTLTGSTEIDSTNENDLIFTRPFGESLTTYFGGVAGIPIRADVTGTYKLRIHITSAADPNTNSNPNTAHNLWIQDVALIESPSASIVPTLLPTNGTAIAVGDSDYLRVAPHKQRYPYTSLAWGSIVLRRESGVRPLCVLSMPMERGVTYDFSDYEINDSRSLLRPDLDDDPRPMRTTHAVYSLLPNQKFYFELYVDTFGTGSTDANYSIGVAPFECSTNYNGAGAALVTGDHVGQYTYCSTGATYTNGTLDGSTVSAWGAGDYIGCGINFTDSKITFYRNGTLVKTMTMNANEKHRLWVGLLGFFSDYSADKQARFTYNFKGPFGGRKPTGFVAFDFDNEVA